MNKKKSSLLTIITTITLHIALVANAEPLKLPDLPNMPASPAAPNSISANNPEETVKTPVNDQVTPLILPTIKAPDSAPTLPAPTVQQAPLAPALPEQEATAPQPNSSVVAPALPDVNTTPVEATVAPTLPSAPQQASPNSATEPVNIITAPALPEPEVPALSNPSPTAQPVNNSNSSKESKPIIDLAIGNHKIGKSVPAPYIDDNSLKIATGTVDGLYYPAGQALCRVINREKKDLNLWCDTEPTDGSIYNLSGLIQAYNNVALVQSDWQKKAFTGTGVFKDQQKSFEDMRFLFSLHNEALTIIVKKTSNITRLEDITHRSVNMGSEGSGVRSIMQTIMNSKGWTNSIFSSVSSISQSNQPSALCKGDIDVMIVAIGHPNDIVRKVSEMCEIRILDITTDPDVQKILVDNAEYAPVTIEGGIYPGIPQTVKTFGVKATVVTTSDMSDDNAYKFVKAIFSKLDYFKKLNPVFRNLSAAGMITEGQIAPIHPGAAKYFKEAKYIK